MIDRAGQVSSGTVIAVFTLAALQHRFRYSLGRLHRPITAGAI
jgi:hypothetical protein